MRLLAIAALVSLSAVISSAGEPGRPASPRAEKPATPAKSDADVQKRVRELVYILRHHRIEVRADEWAGAIRELVQIGKPTVPEIVAELDGTESSATIRGLAFTLRAIGDPRAVPALIRAFDKKEVESGPGFGVAVTDPELTAFMKKNQDYPGGPTDTFPYGRPVNEIWTALIKITKHRQAADLRGAERTRHWNEWWDAHWSEFLTAEESQSVQLPPRDHDLIEEAGTPRFSPLFPTGKDVALGPVHEVELQSVFYVNAKSCIDFDTGRLYQFKEGITADEARSTDDDQVKRRWFLKSGVDAPCNANITGQELQLWRIDNNRWDKLQDEIHTGRPLELGREATNFLLPFARMKTDWRENELGTFLFITREGGRGVVQCFPREDDDTYSHKIRYRMWDEKAAPIVAIPARPARWDESEWEPERVGILRGPGRGQPFLMSLESGERISPPDTLVPATLPWSFSFAKEKELAAWCRVHGANLGTIATRSGGRVAAKAFASVANATTLTLAGLDMQALAVLPSSYEQMTIAELKDLILRWSARTDEGRMPYTAQPRRDTYVIATKSGTLGLLQIKAIRENEGGIAFRYRLAKNPSRKN